MPFESKSQQRKCYAMKARGEAGSWDCEEWSDKTDQKSLPEKASRDWTAMLAWMAARQQGKEEPSIDKEGNNTMTTKQAQGTGAAQPAAQSRFRTGSITIPDDPSLPRSYPRSLRQYGGRGQGTATYPAAPQAPATPPVPTPPPKNQQKQRSFKG